MSGSGPPAGFQVPHKVDKQGFITGVVELIPISSGCGIVGPIASGVASLTPSTAPSNAASEEDELVVVLLCGDSRDIRQSAATAAE